MPGIKELIERIVTRVNINLREPEFDSAPWVKNQVPLSELHRLHAFYGISHLHPVWFAFSRSALAGSYFLGRCSVERSLLYETDVRGDELKEAGDVFRYKDVAIVLPEDEEIAISDSFLVKTLVHSNSHDPESPERFFIANSVSLPYANIHGSPVDGCFLGPFATLDLTSAYHAIIGTFSYVQTGELAHHRVEPGRVWIRSKEFEFSYRFPENALDPYICAEPGGPPRGLFMEVMENARADFERLFGSVRNAHPVPVPESAAVSRYAVVKGATVIGENVLVAQRAYLDSAVMGDGANAQENCCIVNSVLEGLNVTAHGATIIGARMGRGAFTGFNSFLRGDDSRPLTVGHECIVMPHTILDAAEPIEIPPHTLVWGLVRNARELDENSAPIECLMENDNGFNRGNLTFSGSGKAFVKAFLHRITHILEQNGAYSDGVDRSGHAQKGRHITYNILQPYLEGERKGLCPTIRITP